MIHPGSLERLETVTARLDAVTKEREKDVSVLRADLESERAYEPLKD
jgi:hypothetical protein